MSRDQGDMRYNKLYGDIMLDCNTQGVNVYATSGFNNHSTTANAVTVSEAARAQVPIPFNDSWRTAKNVSLDVTWDHDGSDQEYFYIWEPRFTEESGKVFAYNWFTSYLTHDFEDYFYHGWLFIVHVSTSNLTFTITDEDGTESASVTIAHSSGLTEKDFIRLPVVKGKLFRYSLTSAAEFRVEGEESELLVKQWGIGGPWRHARIFQDVPGGEAQ